LITSPPCPLNRRRQAAECGESTVGTLSSPANMPFANRTAANRTAANRIAANRIAANRIAASFALWGRPYTL
jgi:hypothetical protein